MLNIKYVVVKYMIAYLGSYINIPKNKYISLLWLRNY